MEKNYLENYESVTAYKIILAFPRIVNVPPTQYGREAMAGFL